MFCPYSSMDPFNVSSFFKNSCSDSGSQKIFQEWQGFFEKMYMNCFCMKPEFENLFKQYAIDGFEEAKKIAEINQKFCSDYIELLKKNCQCSEKK